MSTRYIVIMSGMSGSGKSTTTKKLGEYYGSRALTIDCDDFDDKNALEALKKTKHLLNYNTIDVYMTKRIHDNMIAIAEIVKRSDHEIIIFCGIGRVIQDISKMINGFEYIFIYLDTSLDILWKQLITREMNVIKDNMDKILTEDISNPHEFYINLIHKYKSRRGFNINPLQLQDQYNAERNDAANSGYVLVDPSEVINYLNKKIKQ